ncbi:MAG: GNAT family N-acetyltransferase [Treponema sp.]|nr:GNAT family N-acetyltransferase [Treponema sp.]
MEIRKISQKDLDTLMDLYVQLSPINEGLPAQKREEIWEQIQNDDKITYLGAYENDQLIATCFLTIIPNFSNQGRPIGFIENVVTDEKWRGKGVGSQLLKKAIELAKEQNCYKVFLESGITRTGAHDFYRSLGFDDTSKKAFIIRF